MLILSLVCLVGWLLSSIYIYNMNMGQGSDVTMGIGFLIQMTYGLISTLFWLLIFFGVGFFIK